MKVVVTGGAGFIGSHIVEHFQGKAEIVVLDNLRSGYLKNLDHLDHQFIEASILDRKAVAGAVKNADYVFHLAAMISVPESMEKPIECEEINTKGILTVLEEAEKAGVKKLVHSSSAANYGDNPIVPKVESMIPEPKSPYAISKLAGEYYCDMFQKEGRLNTAVCRYFNVFGPRQDPKSQYAAAVPIFIDKAVNDADITVFGDGDQTRDFIYVKDIVSANAFLSTAENTVGPHNVAYGDKITINDLASKIISICGSKSEIKHLPERAGDVKHSMASVDKLKGLGWEPASSFNAGLEKTVEYFKSLK
jgi:UDP-glucose 4-epimerase